MVERSSVMVPRPSPSAGGTFARLVAPFEPRDFVARHWDQRAVAFPGSGSARARRLLLDFDLAAFFRAAERAPAGKLAASRTSADESLTGIAIAAGQMEFCFQAGLTVNLQSAQLLDAELAATCSALERELGWPGSVEAYVFWSPMGAGLPMHFDDSPGFVVQLAGQKRWRFSADPALPAPPAPVAAKDVADFRQLYPWSKLRAPAAQALCETVLSPGDVLYTPAGTWHTASACGPEGSLAVTFAFSAPPLHSALAGGLARLFVQEDAWRARVSPRIADEFPAVQHAGRAARLEELKRTVAALTLEDFDRLCGVALKGNDIDGARTGSRDPSAGLELTVEPDDLLKTAGHLDVSPSRDEDGQACFLVRVGGASANVGLEVLGLLDRLSQTQGVFPARATLDWVSRGEAPGKWAAVSGVLSALVERGILELVTDA